MKLTMQREALLKPLQFATGVVERRQTLPILSHLLLTVNEDKLTFLGTDLEVELMGVINLEAKVKAKKELTLPGKKFLDICRTLPENSVLEIMPEDNRVVIAAGRSRFVLTTLPASDFPRTPPQESLMEFTIPQSVLRSLLEKTSFAIPQQDVRQYLNGLLLEVKDGSLQALATDGHRLALNSVVQSNVNNSFAQIMIPRKGVLELLRLLENSEEPVTLSLNNNYLRVQGSDFALTTKLISGKIPNYSRVIPKKGDKQIEIDRDEFKQTLIRVGILSNEIFRSVKFQLREGLLRLVANNPEHEEATEELNIDYLGDNLDTIYNISYLLDIINTINTEKIRISLKNSESGAVIEEIGGNSNCIYVLMPIRQ